jgi:hypothetical protein
MPSYLESYITSFFQTILRNDEKWCEMMGYFNPYLDPFESFISKNVPDFDYQAYKRYPDHNFVYDKLWVAKSQGMLCGKLENLQENSNLSFPIFIKPRWGHKTATSKNCFKIKSYDEAKKYSHIDEMMWSEFVDGKEQMTDYVLLHGKIVYQITYIYSSSQNEFIEDWKYISPNNKPLASITNWVNTHMNNFTGIVNVQYRNDKIIEVSLRFARGGAYILSTKNKSLITNINNVVDKNYWDYQLAENLNFKPFYSFKCYSTAPSFYIFPQAYLDSLMKKYDCMPFYEYYFEPSGKNGMVFLQFLHTNYDKGMKAKKHIEYIFYFTQYLFIIFFIIALYLLQFNKVLSIGILIILGFLYNTRFLNPLGVHYAQFKALKQKYI